MNAFTMILDIHTVHINYRLCTMLLELIQGVVINVYRKTATWILAFFVCYTTT